MEPEISFTKLKFLLSFLLILLIWKPSASFPQEIENISLNTYSQLAIPVPNPIDMTTISPGKSYQVTDPKFILQFFFDGKGIYGIIIKREKENSIFLHWCLFRSCEESRYDYKLKIASAFTPPYEQFFFSAKLLPKLQYRFQGLKFYTVK